MAFFIPVLLAHLPLGLLGFKLEDVLISTGPWVLVVSAIIVFIESGVLFPVLPGDFLIFALGMLHDRLNLPLWLVFPVLIIAAVAGGEIEGSRDGRRRLTIAMVNGDGRVGVHRLRRMALRQVCSTLKAMT